VSGRVEKCGAVMPVESAHAHGLAQSISTYYYILSPPIPKASSSAKDLNTMSMNGEHHVKVQDITYLISFILLLSSMEEISHASLHPAENISPSPVP
jgi:hypothetical protein